MLVFVLLISFFLLLSIGVPISFSPVHLLLHSGYDDRCNSRDQPGPEDLPRHRLLHLAGNPFFVFAGNVMARGGVSKRLTDMAATLGGGCPAALPTWQRCPPPSLARSPALPLLLLPLFGAVMVPEMEKRSHDKAFTAAVVAASGTIGLIIPPATLWLCTARWQTPPSVKCSSAA